MTGKYIMYILFLSLRIILNEISIEMTKEILNAFLFTYFELLYIYFMFLENCYEYAKYKISWDINTVDYKYI